MQRKKRLTISNQLLLSVILPVMLALIALAIINYFSTKNTLVSEYESKTKIISEEIKGVMEFQDFDLELISKRIDDRIINISDKLTQGYFAHQENVVDVDLSKIQEELGMDPALEDIYIINRAGVVVNTTFKKDLNLNLFDFGDQYKNYLLDIWLNNKVLCERFSIEKSTKKLKKYSYQPTKDARYIIEIGVYSTEADEVVNLINNRLNRIAEMQPSIISVDLFIGKDDIVSFNKEAKIPDSHMPLVSRAFLTKETQTKTEKGEIDKHYEYIYMDRKNSTLYKSGIIQIVSDRSGIKELLTRELLKFSLIFGLIIAVLLVIILRNSKSITLPIKNLLDNVKRIGSGNLSERAHVDGNMEIAELAQQFNIMIEELEKSHNELEERVRQRTAEIENQKEEIIAQRDKLEDINIIIEQKNQDITDSIQYAKRIQEAILPHDVLIQKAFKESFVHFRPKDIVSGDFYWFASKDDLAIIAAVDCTGHGVPGAFMSMIGANILNQIINEENIVEPALILDQLHMRIRKALKQDQEGAESRDGMDMALCTFDKKNNTIQFAGAYNPLYLIRNGELEVTKADKNPIGGYQVGAERKFTNHKFEMQKGDCYYIFSDGYHDQFGGEKNKKFMTKRFKELLVSINDKPMSEQAEILESTMEKWRSGTRQIDDILVIGIKV